MRRAMGARMPHAPHAAASAQGEERGREPRGTGGGTAMRAKIKSKVALAEQTLQVDFDLLGESGKPCHESPFLFKPQRRDIQTVDSRDRDPA